MAKLFNDVRPGDLITATLMNQIMDAIETLDDRVNALSGSLPSTGAAPQIFGFSPSGSVPMGTELRVLGVNFGLPMQNQVVIDGIAIPSSSLKTGSGDTLLIFNVPTLQGVPQAGGKSVNVTVTNSRGSATAVIIVTQFVDSIPTGSVFVNLAPVSLLAGLAPGATVPIPFDIKVLSTLQETYAINAQLTPPAGAAGWSVQVFADNAPLAVPEVLIPAGLPPLGSTRRVEARISIPATATIGQVAQLRVTVTSKLNPAMTAATSQFQLTVGGSAPGGSDRIQLSRMSLTGGITESNGVLVVPITSLPGPRVDFRATIRDPGQYNVTASFDSNPGGLWVATIPTGTPVTTTQASEQATIRVRINPASGAAQTTFRVRVSLATDAAVFDEYSQAIRV